MSKKLADLVTIQANNMECVILKVKENSFADLVALGCFSGNETMFRLTKGADHTCTKWCGTNAQSWSWGESGYTLVCDSLSKIGRMVQRTIEDDFGIYIGRDSAKIRQTLHTEKPAPKAEKLVAMWWNGHQNIVVHRRGEFWRGFSSHESFEQYIGQIGGKVTSKSPLYYARTGCCMMDYYIIL